MRHQRRDALLDAPPAMLRHVIPIPREELMYICIATLSFQTENGFVQILVVSPDTIRGKVAGCRCAFSEGCLLLHQAHPNNRIVAPHHHLHHQSLPHTPSTARACAERDKDAGKAEHGMCMEPKGTASRAARLLAAISIQRSITNKQHRTREEGARLHVALRTVPVIRTKKLEAIESHIHPTMKHQQVIKARRSKESISSLVGAAYLVVGRYAQALLPVTLHPGAAVFIRQTRFTL